MSLEAFNSKEVHIGGQVYNLRKFKALDGLKVHQYVLKSGLITDDGINILALEPDMLMEIVCKGCTKGSITLDAKKFDTEFAGRIQDVYQLTSEILGFNFADPNEQAVDSE